MGGEEHMYGRRHSQYRMEPEQGLEFSVFIPRFLPTDVGRNVGLISKIATSACGGSHILYAVCRVTLVKGCDRKVIIMLWLY